jgi:hypothetical protein
MAGMSKAKLNKAVMWGAGGVAVAMLALTGYAVFSGDDDPGTAPGKGGGGSTATAKPAPSYSVPDDWTEPERWAALPRGKRTDANGNDVGFPHSTEGAVSMLAAANSTDVGGSRTTIDEQLGIYHSYMVKADRSPQNAEKIELNAMQTDKDLRRRMGVEAGSALPSGAYVRNHVVGFKVIKESPDEVSVWLLARVTVKAGETKQESGSYTRTLAAAQWEAGDWKLSSAATVRASQQTQGQSKPTMVAPGDAAFNDAGWAAIREAS